MNVSVLGRWVLWTEMGLEQFHEQDWLKLCLEGMEGLVGLRTWRLERSGHYYQRNINQPRGRKKIIQSIQEILKKIKNGNVLMGLECQTEDPECPSLSCLDIKKDSNFWTGLLCLSYTLCLQWSCPHPHSHHHPFLAIAGSFSFALNVHFLRTPCTCNLSSLTFYHSISDLFEYN